MDRFCFRLNNSHVYTTTHISKAHAHQTPSWFRHRRGERERDWLLHFNIRFFLLCMSGENRVFLPLKFSRLHYSQSFYFVLFYFFCTLNALSVFSCSTALLFYYMIHVNMVSRIFFVLILNVAWVDYNVIKIECVIL